MERDVFLEAGLEFERPRFVDYKETSPLIIE
jgi:hypothetical protein